MKGNLSFLWVISFTVKLFLLLGFSPSNIQLESAFYNLNPFFYVLCSGTREILFLSFCVTSFQVFEECYHIQTTHHFSRLNTQFLVPDYLYHPSWKLFKFPSILLKVWYPEVDAGFKMGSDQSRTKWNHISWSFGNYKWLKLVSEFCAANHTIG